MPIDKLQNSILAVANMANLCRVELVTLYNDDKVRNLWAKDIVDALDDWEKASNETLNNLHNWKAQVRYFALSSTVLAVATTRIEGTWTAYVNAVPGQSHHREFPSVLEEGTKLPEGVARSVFGHMPEFSAVIPYAK